MEGKAGRFLGAAVLSTLLLACPGGRRALAGKIGDGSIDFEIVGGFRSDSRIRFRLPRGILGGLRSTEGDRAAFLVLPLGGETKLIAGDFRIRAGEGVVLGAWERRFFLYRGARRRGSFFRVSPSLSSWWRQRGGALAMDVGGSECVLAFFSPGGGSAGDMPYSGFFAGFGRSAEGGGVGGGVLVPVSRAGRGDSREAAWMTFFRAEREGLRASGEADVVGGRIGAAARADVGSAPSCSARFAWFPALPAGGVWHGVLGAEDGPYRAARLELALDAWRLGPALAVEISSRESRRRDRSDAGVEMSVRGGRGKPLRWKAAVELSERSRVDHAAGGFPAPGRRRRDGEVSCRLAGRLRSGAFTHFLSLDVFLPTGGRLRRGLSLQVGVDLRTRFVEFSLRAARYALGGERMHVLFRRGVGYFENFRLVRSEGGDLSARVKIEPVDGLELYGCCVVPSPLGPRFYAAAGCRY